MNPRPSGSRKRWVVIGLLVALFTLPWTAPRLVLGGLNRALQVVDSEFIGVFVFGCRPWAVDFPTCQETELWLGKMGVPPGRGSRSDWEFTEPRATLIDSETDFIAPMFIRKGADGTEMTLEPVNGLHRLIIDQMTSAMPELEDPASRRQLAELLQKIPDRCPRVREGGASLMDITVEPSAERAGVSHFFRNDRRIERVLVREGFDKDLPECHYHRSEDARHEFTFADLKELLVRCRAATETTRYGCY